MVLSLLHSSLFLSRHASTVLPIDQELEDPERPAKINVVRNFCRALVLLYRSSALDACVCLLERSAACIILHIERTTIR